MRVVETGRAVTDTSCRGRLRAVAFGNMRPALAMHCSRVLHMHCRVARAVSVAHERPELKPVIVRNFTPALAALVQRNNIVKTLACGVSQQMRLLQAAPAKTSRCSFRLQRRDWNSGCRRNSVQVGCAGRDGREHQNKCRYDYT